MRHAEIGRFLGDPKGCDHDWQPVSFVFETQILDDSGRVVVRQPAIDDGRVYLVCLLCAQHTYMETNWVTYRFPGSLDRTYGDDLYFKYKPNSSHKYSVDDGETWQQEYPRAPDVGEVMLVCDECGPVGGAPDIPSALDAAVEDHWADAHQPMISFRRPTDEQ